MRILFLCQLVPWPLDAGPKTRAYYVLRHLAEAGHELHLAALARAADRSAEAAELERLCASVTTIPLPRSRARDAWHLVRSMLGPTPFLIARDHSGAFRRAVADLVNERQIDAVHADQLWMAPYAAEVRRRSGGRGPRSILDQHNAVFRVADQLAATASWPASVLLRRESAKLRRYERAACSDFDSVVWVSGVDRDAVLGPRAPVERGRVIPIGIDPDPLSPAAERAPRQPRVTFLGGLHWPPNAQGVRWLVERVWPTVRSEAPEARLCVIGRIGEHGGAALRARVAGDASLELTGYLADPGSLLAETGVFVVPLLAGAGMRVKILEAWCRGLAVVSTRLGAEGVAAVDGRNLLLADTPQDFARAVLRVLRDRELAHRLGREGRRTVEERYHWRRLYSAWDEVYEAPSHSRSGGSTVSLADR